jgi:hypothetical protein
LKDFKPSMVYMNPDNTVSHTANAVPVQLAWKYTSQSIRLPSWQPFYTNLPVYTTKPADLFNQIFLLLRNKQPFFED